MTGISFDISHMLAGFLVLLSFLMLYQVRLPPLLNVLAAHAFALSLSVAWQAHTQDAPHLYITAVIALVFKAIVIPGALHRIIKQLGIHRDIESAVGIGLGVRAALRSSRPQINWRLVRGMANSQIRAMPPPESQPESLRAQGRPARPAWPDSCSNRPRPKG
jgi:hypothetical protein